MSIQGTCCYGIVTGLRKGFMHLVVNRENLESLPERGGRGIIGTLASRSWARNVWTGGNRTRHAMTTMDLPRNSEFGDATRVFWKDEGPHCISACTQAAAGLVDTPHGLGQGILGARLWQPTTLAPEAPARP